MFLAFQDLKYAFRRLGKSRVFALTSVLTLAVGIAAAAAIFSLAYIVLIAPLPYESPATLVSLGWCDPKADDCRWPAYSPRQISEITDATAIFTSVTATSVDDVARTDTERPEIVRSAFVTTNTLSILGAKPIVGRLPVAEDAQADAPFVALLSHRYWRNRFGGDEKVLGRVLVMNGRPRIVIGVLPPRFLWQGADAYMPVHVGNQQAIEGQSRFVLFGRLNAGVTPAQAQTGLQHVFDNFSRAMPDAFRPEGRVQVRTLQDMSYAGFEDILVLLIVAALALLLIACVNVSGLLLARAVGQEREIAVRTALGATRGQLMWQALADTLALSFCALPLGIVMAHFSLAAIMATLPQGYLPPESEISINLPFLLAALAVSFLTAILAGIGPAWHLARANLHQGFGQALRANSMRPAQVWTLNGLVVVEIALSLVLLTVAGLFLHSSFRLWSVHFPFKPEEILTLRVPLPADRYVDRASRNRFVSNLLEGVRRIPGGSNATVDTALPFFEFWSAYVRVPGYPPAERWSILHATNADYFSIFGEAFVRGRPFTEAEVSSGRHVMVVNREFARIFLDGHDPVGKTIHLVELPAPASLADDAFEVIGLIEDGRATLTVEKYPQAFIPHTVLGMSNVLAVRSGMDPALVAASIREVVYSLDKELAPTRVQTMEAALVEQGYAAPQFQLILLGVFATSGLLLMALGVYGMVSSSVARRRKEIAIRLSLGAQRARVFWMVLRRALALGIAGAAIGVPLSLATNHSAQFVLYDTNWNDPFVLSAAAITLLVVVSLAAAVPARHAACTDPMQNLREE
ncbi:MAG: ADOP family duplicated permease [Candidatus Acidiferrales bacterium]